MVRWSRRHWIGCLLRRLLPGCRFGSSAWYKSRKHNPGWYWSSTTGGLVAHESRLELARILLADFDAEVTGLAAQPFQLSGLDGGKARRHVPDLLLRRKSGLVAVDDVKRPHRVSDPKV